MKLNGGQKILRPTKAVISLKNLLSNFSKLKEIAGTAVMPVVKANAYGHGALQVAASLEDAGADMLGVATIEEGIKLRESGIKLPILILGSIYPFKNFDQVIENNLTPIAASIKSAKALEETAKKYGTVVNVHIKVDTGMGRIGISPPAGRKLYEYVAESEFIFPEGIFTHLSCADSDYNFTKKQLKDFKELTEKLKPSPKYIHAANSAGVIKYPESHFNFVRPGLALYGLYPDGINRDEIDLKPVMSWETSIIFLKEVPEGTPVSYGGTWKAPVRSKIATLCVGYADGYSRKLSNKATVLIKGQKCPVVGRVCMDMIMVDVTKVKDVEVGDRAVLIGVSGKEKITAEDMAEVAGTINYEITTCISSRVPRVFKYN